jgi:ferrochelatase
MRASGIVPHRSSEHFPRMRYRIPSEQRPAESAHLGVLLVNSGTPASLATRDVRHFLKGLLSDPRVVELPRALWLPILYGFILPFRPARVARKYERIWTEEGSPLVAISTRLRSELTRALAQRLSGRISVEIGMLYSPPSVGDALRTLSDAGAEQLLVVPLFPQYSGATTGAVHDGVSRELSGWRRVPQLRYVGDYHDDAGYIEALRVSVAEQWAVHGRTSHLVMSFHGIPLRYTEAGDPYFRRCQETARRLAAALGLGEDEWTAAFQSRFGAAEWLKPYTIDFISGLPRRGVSDITVVCPGFAVDCLETLEEIAIENRDAFMAAGGRKFLYVPALNARPAHAQVLADLIARNGQGWG